MALLSTISLLTIPSGSKRTWDQDPETLLRGSERTDVGEAGALEKEALVLYAATERSGSHRPRGDEFVVDSQRASGRDD